MSPCSLIIFLPSLTNFITEINVKHFVCVQNLTTLILKKMLSLVWFSLDFLNQETFVLFK